MGTERKIAGGKTENAEEMKKAVNPHNITVSAETSDH